MTSNQIHPDNTVFVILSFEGPDRYAQAGGLGVRVTQLSHTLAGHGFQTHLLFVGDPNLPGLEQQLGGRLSLHRWCQWISPHHPLGVYDGEEGKREDLTTSAPPFIVEEIARPAIAQERLLVVLAEEWHTAEALCRLSDLLHAAGLRQQAVLFWNANNTMSFHRVDWQRLKYVARLATVSRYMKHLMRNLGVDPLVIPNGIPADLLEPVDAEAVSAVRQALAADDRRLLFKVGRFDPAKGWLMAVEAAARLKALGQAVAFPFRGGIEPHGAEVLARAQQLGLTVRDVTGAPATWCDVLDLIQAAGPADLYNLRFFMTQAMLRPFYAAADVVLANSSHEPFGLVGLEAMAAGGIVFTGPTGETYSYDGQGALALDTDNPDEIVLHILDLRTHPERSLAMRRAAWRKAAQFTWDTVLELLLCKVALAACEQAVIQLSRAGAGLGISRPSGGVTARRPLGNGRGDGSRAREWRDAGHLHPALPSAGHVGLADPQVVGAAGQRSSGGEPPEVRRAAAKCNKQALTSTGGRRRVSRVYTVVNAPEVITLMSNKVKHYLFMLMTDSRRAAGVADMRFVL